MGQVWLFSIMVSIALFLWLYHEIKHYLVDSARQQIFEHRNTIFAIAAEGQIGFDDQGYKVVRRSLNGMIRYAHRADILDLSYLAGVVGALEEKDSSPRELIDLIADEELKKQIRQHYYLSVGEILKLATLRQPLAVFGILWLAAINLKRVLATGMRGAWKVFRWRLNLAVEHESAASF